MMIVRRCRLTLFFARMAATLLLIRLNCLVVAYDITNFWMMMTTCRRSLSHSMIIIAYYYTTTMKRTTSSYI
jgi:hypothetical protein